MADYTEHLISMAGGGGDDAKPSIYECGISELSEEDKQRQLQRKADKSDLINWILHYKNPADDDAMLRQIRLVME